MTALAASIGTGNIAGVATAIVSGGPGALFWIWVYGFVAMAIKFAEASLGLTFREIRGGTVLSGPMYYLRDGLRSPALAWLFALVAAVAALTTTPFTQPNSIALVVNSVFGVSEGRDRHRDRGPDVAGDHRRNQIDRPRGGAALAVESGVVSGRRADRDSGQCARAFRGARDDRPSGVFDAGGRGGALGMLVAMRYGIARGIYANEAGYGTAAVAYGTAQSSQPVQQGLNAVIEVFTVSFVTSTISAMTILLTGAWQSGLTSSAAVAAGFNTVMPTIGGWVVAFCVFLFGYTTLIGWAYYGEQFFEYILGRNVTVPYRWIYCLLIPFGAVTKVDVVWAWGDLMNALQVFPNLIGLIGLSGLVAQIARERLARASSGLLGSDPGHGTAFAS